jgi:hypothetical protein
MVMEPRMMDHSDVRSSCAEPRAFCHSLSSPSNPSILIVEYTVSMKKLKAKMYNLGFGGSENSRLAAR